MTDKPLTINFLEKHKLDDQSVRLVQGTIGLYFIFLKDLEISYPFKLSRLIYIGMSESIQNSIGNRLRAHLTGQSGNKAISNYSTSYTVFFTTHTIQLLKILGTDNLFELESFFLSDFHRIHGSFPICNNQSGVSFPETQLSEKNIEVLWNYFY